MDNRLSNGCPGMGLIATFPVDIDAGAAISRSVNHDPLVAFAHGLTFLVFVVALGGGHNRPRNSGSVSNHRVTPYIVAQIAGGIAAAWCCSGVWRAGGQPTLVPHWSTRSGPPTAARHFAVGAWR